MTMKLTTHPDLPDHFRIWRDGREIGYLRKADEVIPKIWRACDDSGQRVTEASSKKKCMREFEARYDLGDSRISA